MPDSPEYEKRKRLNNKHLNLFIIYLSAERITKENAETSITKITRFKLILKPTQGSWNEPLYLIKGDVLSDHAAQAVDEGREGDGAWSIAVPPNLCSRPCEVKLRAALW